VGCEFVEKTTALQNITPIYVEHENETNMIIL